MIDPPGNSPSKYHHLFSRKPSHIGNTNILSSISSFLDDDRIEQLENNQRNFLWCNVIFKGIDANRALAHVMRTKFMQINRYRASTD